MAQLRTRAFQCYPRGIAMDRCCSSCQQSYRKIRKRTQDNQDCRERLRPHIRAHAAPGRYVQAAWRSLGSECCARAYLWRARSKSFGRSPQHWCDFLRSEVEENKHTAPRRFPVPPSFLGLCLRCLLLSRASTPWRFAH